MACYRIYGHGGDDVIVSRGMPGTPLRVWNGDGWEDTPFGSEVAKDDEAMICFGLTYAFATDPDLHDAIKSAQIEACADPEEGITS